MDAYVKPSVFPGCFANGLPASEGGAPPPNEQLLATSMVTDKLAPSGQTTPSWAVIGTEDDVIPPAEQLVMAQRAGAHITEMDAPDLSTIWDPGVVTRSIIAAARRPATPTGARNKASWREGGRKTQM